MRPVTLETLQILTFKFSDCRKNMPSKYWLGHSSEESKHLLPGSVYPLLAVILTLKLAEITKLSISLPTFFEVK